MRVALHTRLKPGKETEYDRVHAVIFAYGWTLSRSPPKQERSKNTLATPPLRCQHFDLYLLSPKLFRRVPRGHINIDLAPVNLAARILHAIDAGISPRVL